MKALRLIIEATIALLLSYMLLEGVKHLINGNSAVSTDNTEEVITQSIKNSNKNSDLDQKLLECLKKTPIVSHDQCFNQRPKKYENENIVEMAKKEVRSESPFIMVVFWFITLLLSIQLVIAMEAYYEVKMKWVSKYMLSISEFNIQVPPMAGIAGTLYSVAVFASASDSVSSVISLFKENIAYAIGTTLFAIVVYIINRFIHIFITSRSENV